MPAIFQKNRVPHASCQRGAVLMLLLLLVSVGALAVFVSGLNRATQQLERDRITHEALARAKEALIGYAIKRQDPERPGDMPCPDNTGDGDYDGTQDSPCGNNTPSPRLGRLPWRSADVGGTPVDGLNNDLVDGKGERLWYAVSRNLVDAAGVPQLNSSILSAAPRPWISIRAANGQVASSRVAVVILSPGTTLEGQDRAGVTPNAAQFLDQLMIGAVSYSNNDTNDCLDGTSCPTISSRSGEDFIMGAASLTFNDRLIYVTIEELMTAVGKRVAGEVGLRLPHPYPDDMTAIVWPAWLNDNNWLGSIAYIKVSDDKATVSFSGCAGLALAMEWNALNSRTDTKWAGKC